MQHNSYRFFIDKVIEPLRTKMERITLFISLSDEDLPVIPERREYLNQFVTQTRMYFNDNELLIFKDPETRENYLTSKEFETNIMQVLNKLTENKKTYEEINFVDVIEEWLMKDVMVQVWYQVYDDVVRNNVEEYLMNVGNEVAVCMAKEMNNNNNNNKKKNSNDIGKIMIINKQKSEQNKLSHKKDITKLTIHQESIVEKKSSSNNNNNNILPFILSPKQQSLLSPKQQSSEISTSPEEPNDTFTYYLQKFYLHYAKKSPKTNQTQQFEQLEHFYTTVNLNKFMLYCKEIGLLKIDKKITINFVKKLFVNNQDERKVVEFEVFAKIIKEILLKVFKTEDGVNEQGYEIIGVKDRRNFVETMGKIGVLVPLKKIVFSKVENVKKEKKTIVDLEMLDRLKSIEKKSEKLRLKENISLSKLEKQTILKTNGGYSEQLRPSPQREQQNINNPFTINNNTRQLTKSESSTSLSTLPTIYSHKKENQHHHEKETKMLEELLELDVENDDDPYLQRFKDQQLRLEREQEKEREKYLGKRKIENIEELEEDKNNEGHHEGVIERMDRRMNNMVRKVR